MPDELPLRAAARVALKQGDLPARHPDRIWGGQGTGALCAVCQRAIGRDEAELEIEFDHAGGYPGMDRHVIHPRCFAAWEFELTKLERPPDA